MLIFFILILCLAFYRIQYSRNSVFNNYLDRNQTSSIKGIFILMVFIRHIYQYILKSGYEMTSFLDQIGWAIDKRLGQFIVTLFLFYSGYGVMESILAKGYDYVKRMPTKRILSTLINFDVAVLVFLIATLLLGKHYTVNRVILSFFGWSSVGNSNWYIFSIILCYLLTYLTFYFKNKPGTPISNPPLRISITTIAIIIAMFILAEVKEPWWYNTILCFPFGMIYSYNKGKIKDFVSSHYWYSLLITIILFIFFTKFRIGGYAITNNICSILFSLLIVFITMKIRIDNKPLQWLGHNLFSLYIYQRLFMIILFEFQDGIFVREHVSLYFSICLCCTLITGYLYKYWQVTLK